MVEDSTRTKEELFYKADSNKQPAVNKNYKDTIFRKLFHNKKELLGLYNALNDSCYSKEEDLEIVTLDSCLYLSIRNDLAFILDFRMYLYEHQSTPSPNMPLRNLFYVSQEYYAMVDNESLFGERPVRIPAPRFVVFYNGQSAQPEKQILKLSDLYMPKETEPVLELQVLVLNINKGYNTWLREKCKTLHEYMLYVEKVRYYRNVLKYPLKQAVEIAIDECIKEGILAEFLSRNRAEAVMFSINEHNEEREWQKLRESEREYGIEIGIERGREEEQKRLVENLMRNKGMTLEEAKEVLGIENE